MSGIDRRRGYMGCGVCGFEVGVRVVVAVVVVWGWGGWVGGNGGTGIT